MTLMLIVVHCKKEALRYTVKYMYVGIGWWEPPVDEC
jgi:hypothetical protein